jgi:hypothetical protein
VVDPVADNSDDLALVGIEVVALQCGHVVESDGSAADPAVAT